MQTHLSSSTAEMHCLPEARSMSKDDALPHAGGGGTDAPRDYMRAAAGTRANSFKGARPRFMEATPIGVRMHARQSVRQANHLLAALSSDAMERLLPMMEMVNVKPGMRLMQAEQMPTHVYFPRSATVSLLLTTLKGQTCQVGMIGNEGMVGVHGIVSGLRMPYDAVVSTEGMAQRVSTSALGSACGTGSAGGALFVRYLQTLTAQMAYNVACCQHHSIEERACRLLLQAFDASGSELRMTHEMMAELLGVRRESVTAAALRLSQDGVISYRRGCILLMDMTALQARSCECYETLKQEHERAFPANSPQPGSLSINPERTSHASRQQSGLLDGLHRMLG